MKLRSYVVFFSAAAVVIVLVTVSLVSGRNGDGDTGTAAQHAQSVGQVRVKITDEPVVSRNQDPMYVELESGSIPEDATNITVLTDQNCQPDQDGVSHCLNRISYQTPGDTGEAALRHHHRMSEEPCLAPGQVLEIVV